MTPKIIEATNEPQPSTTCPKCGRVSYNPGDIRNLYCAVCGFYDEASVTEIQASLLTTLIATRTLMKNCLKGMHYCGREDFLLQHGRFFEVEPWDGTYKQGVPKQCFGNAILTCAMYDLRYVEGVAIAPHGAGMAIHHAWNVDAAGKVVDTTWCNTGLIYMGVEFALGRADDATWNGDAAILDDYKRKYPIFQQPWKGEDGHIFWPPSDGMNLIYEAINILREK
jgi:ribosomal protein L37E